MQDRCSAARPVGATPALGIPPCRLLAVGDTFGIRDRGSGALMLELVFS